ncbi:flagellar biosynthesis protein FlhB [bacterium]|nr:flagellar biosynthesis protein FlhB [bacterium]MBU1753913.1 flagellar biosynthesis protein FlhB [bacterium]
MLEQYDTQYRVEYAGYSPVPIEFLRLEQDKEYEKKQVDQVDTFDLQLFARAEDEGRTEDPTPRKRQQAREKGQVVKSMELTSASITLITCLAMSMLGYYMFTMMMGYSAYCFSHVHEVEFSPDNISRLFPVIIIAFFKITLPIMLIAAVVAVAVEALQVGIYFAPKALRFDFSKMRFNISKVWQRLIPSRIALIEYGKTFLKIAVIVCISYAIIHKEFSQLLNLLDVGLMEGLTFIAGLTFKIIIYVAIFLIIISLFDYLHQRHEYKQGLMMTKHELKDEWRQLEGDPSVKRKIRQRQRETAAKRMMAEIAKANVIITNPTHLAIAIKYDSDYMVAPTVVAKGKGLMAQRIIDIAKENDVPIVENKPLAAALFETVDIGSEITPQFYQTVAEILAFVYRLKQKAA